MSMTLDQQRAQYAWDKSSEAVAGHFIDEYTRSAKSTASLIMNSGLMQTLAFLKSKKENEHKALLAHILKWLDIRYPTKKKNSPPRNFEFVMKEMHQIDSETYMQLTSETMALLRWIRQFSDAQKATENAQ